MDFQFVGSSPISGLRRGAADSRQRDIAASAGVDQAQGGKRAGSARVSSIAAAATRVIALSALVFSAALADELAPDALIRTIADGVVAAIKQDAKLTDDPDRVAALVEARVLPHFDFAHTTRIAMGVNWRRATPEQQERLTLEFRTLLVRTYSTALANYRDQAIDVRPLRARPEDVQVTVHSEVRQQGAQPMSIDYDLEKTQAGWKVFDIRIAGASLAATYRDTFAEIVRNHGVEGLIEQLSSKNRQGRNQRANT